MGAQRKKGENVLSANLLTVHLRLCSAWAILLDRSQTRLQIVLIPPELFIPVEDDAMERQRLIESVPDSVTPLIIYEETTDIWINVRSSRLGRRRCLVTDHPRDGFSLVVVNA